MRFLKYALKNPISGMAVAWSLLDASGVGYFHTFLMIDTTRCRFLIMSRLPPLLLRICFFLFFANEYLGRLMQNFYAIPTPVAV